jgi:hypothetical protein
MALPEADQSGELVTDQSDFDILSIPLACTISAEDYMSLGIPTAPTPSTWAKSPASATWEDDLSMHMVQNHSTVSITHPNKGMPKTQGDHNNRKKSMGSQSMNMGSFHLALDDQDYHSWKKKVGTVPSINSKRREI